MYTTNTPEFAVRLKKLRKEYKLTQIELAQNLNITQTQISRYESGQDRPAPMQMKKITTFFKVSEDYLSGKETTTEFVAETADAEYSTLALRIKSIRTYFGQSQEEFAKELSISQSALSAIELDKVSPPVEAIQKLGRMGFDVNWLLYGKTNVTETPKEIFEKNAVDWETKRILKLLNNYTQDKLRVLRQCLELIDHIKKS